MKRLQSLRLVIISLLLTMSLLRCGCGSGPENPDLLFVEPSKDALFKYLGDMLESLKTEDSNMCGIFSTNKDTKEGEIVKKTDTTGGNYEYSLKTYSKKGTDSILNSKTITTFKNPLENVKEGDKVFVYEFKNYCGDCKPFMETGPIIKISGEMIGTQWDPDQGTMRLDASIGLTTFGKSDYLIEDSDDDPTKAVVQKYGKVLGYTTIYIRNLGIDNGSDGKKKGTLESLKKLSKDSSHNEIFISGKAITINIKDKNDSKYKEWLQQFISCEKISSTKTDDA